MTGAAPHRLSALAGRQAHGWARPPCMHAAYTDQGRRFSPGRWTGYVPSPSILSLDRLTRWSRWCWREPQSYDQGLVRLWPGLTLPSASRRCPGPDRCRSPGQRPRALDAPGGIMLVDLIAQVGLDSADGPWPQISASKGVADDADHQRRLDGGADV